MPLERIPGFLPRSLCTLLLSALLLTPFIFSGAMGPTGNRHPSGREQDRLCQRSSSGRPDLMR